MIELDYVRADMCVYNININGKGNKQMNHETNSKYIDMTEDERAYLESRFGSYDLKKKNKMDPKKAKTHLYLNEVFGPTIQGESVVVGQKTIFVRTQSCQFNCAWCDSLASWDGSEPGEYFTPVEVFRKVLTLAAPKDGSAAFGEDGLAIYQPTTNWNCKHVTMTGGNPSLQGQPMDELIDLFHQIGWQVSLETQGVNYQPWFKKIDQLVISPKGPSSHMRQSLPLLDKIISQLDEDGVDYTLKPVVFDQADMEFARMIYKRYPQAPHKYMSVGNVDPEEDGDISHRILYKLGQVWQQILDDPDFNDVRPLPQMHTLVYANARKK